MQEMTIEELLAKTSSPFPEFALTAEPTALLLIDMQRLAGTEWLVLKAIEKGIAEEDAKRAVESMDRQVKRALRNARRVLEACREAGIAAIHVKIEAMMTDGRDVGRLHKILGYVVNPRSKWGQFFEEVAPEKGEVVLTKTCSGAFVGTNLDQILRNMDVDTLIIVGFYTDQCVETAARDAADLGYKVILVEDACATETAERHSHSIDAIRDVYVRIEKTEEILAAIVGLAKGTQHRKKEGAR